MCIHACIGQKEGYLGMSLLKYFPVTMIDTMVMLMAKAMLFMYGDPFKYGAADQHKAFSPPNSLPDK